MWAVSSSLELDKYNLIAVMTGRLHVIANALSVRIAEDWNRWPKQGQEFHRKFIFLFFLRTALISGARHALGNQIVLYSEGAGPDNLMRLLLVLTDAVWSSKCLMQYARRRAERKVNLIKNLWSIWGLGIFLEQTT